MSLDQLLALVPAEMRDSLRSLLVELVRRYALKEVNGLALLADWEELKSILGTWISSPLASPEPSQRIDCSEPLP